MKRILASLTLLLLITACDDGDLQVVNIDFSEVTANKCPEKDVIYKVKESEMLVLVIPATTFASDETADNTPIVVNIAGDVEVIYRQYNGTVSSDNICPTVPAANPNLIEEWNATSGTIEITTTAVTSINSTTGVMQITGYKHYIVLRNVTFQKSDGTTQTYETYIYGNYITNNTALAFGFDQEVDKSSCDNRIFNFNSSEAFILDLADYANLIQNSATTTPRTAYISATNKVNYQLYTGTVNDAFFCTIPTPTTATLSQNWTANNGDAVNGTGIIEVSTAPFGSGFQHTIRLKKVTMTKGNSEFYLGDDYLYGSFTTNP